MRPVIALTTHANSATSGRLQYGCNASYIRAVRAEGAIPLLVPPQGEMGAVEQLVELIDGLLLPGGVDIAPERYHQSPQPGLGPFDLELDAFELELTAAAYERDVPTLGICRGIQTIAVALGGSLYQDLPSQWPGATHDYSDQGRGHLAHDITVDPGSLLSAALQRSSVTVNSLHHQAVRTLPPNLIEVAWSPDGVIEAVEAPSKRFVVGVQCHPEEIWETTAPEFARLFSAFIEAASERLGKRIQQI